MKIKFIKLTDFKRFTDLEINEIPKEAKLVVMIGPNGSGKSSVLEALQLLRLSNGFGGWSGKIDYYLKSGVLDSNKTNGILDNLKLEFHGELPSNRDDWKKALQVRSSYRNDSTVESSQRDRVRSPLEQKRYRLVENDESVVANYQWLQSRWAEVSSHLERFEENRESLQKEVFGKLRDAMRILFDNPELVLMGLGNRDEQQIFQFKKGASREFSYMNLSSGEKAVLDLILDLIVAKDQFNDTVFAIDEPEAHIHTKLQGPLLGELYNLIPENSQLWIATHSIGMVRKAQDLWREGKNKGKDLVVFLDFGREDLDFDKKAPITPSPPDSGFWERVYEIALGDLAELVLNERTVFCESRGFDAECYRNIFKNHYPELSFNPLEGRDNVLKTVEAANLVLRKIAKKAMVIGIVDKDDALPPDIERRKKKGIRTLSRRTIENFLLDDEVLSKLCEDYGEPDKVDDLLAAKQEALDKHNLKSDDNLKAIVQPIRNAAKKALNPAKLGVSRESFMMDILAPRIQPGMDIYDELHDNIFGE